MQPNGPLLSKFSFRSRYEHFLSTAVFYQYWGLYYLLLLQGIWQQTGHQARMCNIWSHQTYSIMPYVSAATFLFFSHL
ncbi:hypothetical protein F5Y19DRAFT_433996 [Xylariaceae sp. FL1651]|nr:hypothetical protein F5Y19DRAFT_433996 [Xylariaceae sp. FL1651]